MYFYNEEGEEVGVVDVNEFPIPAVKDTSYDPSTEILTITVERSSDSVNAMYMNLV